MEDIAWKKDETPYIIFPCSKCHQYTYTKSTQKSKKCIRCGYTHKVSKIKEHGETIKGISNAVELVKKKQHKLAIKELGSEPEFRSSGDFKVATNVNYNKKTSLFEMNEGDYSKKFEHMIYNLSETHNTFPYYIIEIMAENYGIPQLEVKLLTRKLQRKGLLIRKNGEYSYKMKV